jgi:hypothetical protein
VFQVHLLSECQSKDQYFDVIMLPGPIGADFEEVVRLTMCLA